MASHDERIDGLRRAYDEAHGRFVARLERVAAEALEAVPSEGGWSAAQIAWHVAAVDTAFAGLISGQRPSQPLAADFQERAWSDVVALIPRQLEASRSVMPPPGVRRDEALLALAGAATRMTSALRDLTAERGAGFGISHHLVGTINLYQIGDWAIAHTIRHNAQAKKLLGV